MNWYEATARVKLGKSPEWEACHLEVINRETGDIDIRGGIPSTSRNGKKKWDTKRLDRCFVSKAEISKVRSDYEASTGNCSECEGRGKTVKSFGINPEWHPTDPGKYYETFRSCSHCSGTGKAKS